MPVSGALALLAFWRCLRPQQGRGCLQDKTASIMKVVANLFVITSHGWLQTSRALAYYPTVDYTQLLTTNVEYKKTTCRLWLAAYSSAEHSRGMRFKQSAARHWSHFCGPLHVHCTAHRGSALVLAPCCTWRHGLPCTTLVLHAHFLSVSSV